MDVERVVRRVALRLRSLFRRASVERELDEELRYHVEHQIELNLRHGMTPREARTAALRAFGGAEQHKEACRDRRGTAVVDHGLRDLRYALRVLRRSPVFTMVAVCSLALGIGANAAIFQLIDVVRLRTLPIAAPQELAEIRVAGVRNFGVSDGFNSEITNPLWEQIRENQRAFSGAFAWGQFRPLIGRGAQAQRARALWVSGGFFPVLGIVPARGRLLAPSDDRRGCGVGPVVVSYAFWQRYFGGQERAIGSTLTILDQTFTVVGVTPANFTGLEVGRGFDVALPVCVAGIWGPALDQRNYWWLTVMGRLKPGWTLAQGGDHLSGLSTGMFAATLPSGYSAESSARYLGFRLTMLAAARGVSWLRSDYGTALWLLLGMTGLVLLITCGNLATLMLARASARTREMVVRVALGASRSRVVAQLLMESVLVAVAGAALAVPVSLLASFALVAFLDTETSPVQLDLSADWRVVFFIAATAACTALLFGAWPALKLSMVEPGGVMRQASRGVTVDRRRAVFQRTLVAGQIAFALVLVVSALLFVQSFQNLIATDTGFRQKGLFYVSFLDLRSAGLPLQARVAFQRRLTDEVQSVPGVAGAASASLLPLTGAGWGQAFRVPTVSGEQRKISRFTYVSPRYFATLEMPILSGRDFTNSDGAESRRVALVNQTFVRRHLGAVNPIGTRFRTFEEPGYPEATYEIIGVVADTAYSDLREDRQSIAYVPLAQHPALRPWASMVVRTVDPPAGVIAAIRARVAGLNPDIALQVTELDGQIRQRLVGERMLAWLAASFGVLAITLAAVGLYGVVAYVAGSRRNEIGIRLSLGSSRTQVVRLLLRDSAQLVAVGLAAGIPLAVAAVYGARTLLFGVSIGDPALHVAAGGLLASVTVLSAAFPAWRASRLDPVAALRAD